MPKNLLKVEIFNQGVTESQYEEICDLLTQHYGTLPSYPSMEQVEETARVHTMFIVRDNGKVVAMATLVVYRKFAKVVGHIEEDVILASLPNREEVREMLFSVMAEHGRSLGVLTLDLETFAEKTEDTAAYLKLGYFLRKNIEVYRIRL